MTTLKFHCQMIPNDYMELTLTDDAGKLTIDSAGYSYASTALDADLLAYLGERVEPGTLVRHKTRGDLLLDIDRENVSGALVALWDAKAPAWLTVELSREDYRAMRRAIADHLTAKGGN